MNTSWGPRGHAVVIGGSIAGILTARALSETFARVTVVERDRFPEQPAPRRGVPQSGQVHGLLARGRLVLEELFPGFTDEVVAAGACLADLQADMHWYQDGRLVKPAVSGLLGVGVSRPLLEHTLRARVAGIDGVSFRERCEVLGLLASADRRRVTGVRLRGLDGAVGSELPADLVVDASGRGSRSPAWLEELGYRRPREESVRVRTTYVARLYRRESLLDGRALTACSAYPGTPRSAIAIAQEGDRLLMSLGGWTGVVPPTDDAGALAYAESLAAPDFAEVIRTGKPLGEPVLMRFPASVRTRYEDLADFPGGYLVAGDALCSFNPFYGQGMTVAALQALALRDLLDEDRQHQDHGDEDHGDGHRQDGGHRDDPGARFFRAAARVLDVPWGMAVAGDLRFPEVEGVRTPRTREMGDYLTRYRVAAADDAYLGTVLLRVTHMLDGPAALTAPDVVARVEAGFRASGVPA